MASAVLKVNKTETISNNSFSASKIIPKTGSWWSHLELCSLDGVWNVFTAFNECTNSKKINLAVGTYKNNDGKPHVLNCVLKAEEQLISEKLDKEYSLISGIPEFCNLSIRLALGEDNAYIKNNAYATVQGISGTGSLAIGAKFFYLYFPGVKCIWLPKPTWSNHANVFREVGLEVKQYRYYNPKTCGFNFEGAIEDIKKIPEQSIILFQACGHNPTGADPTPTQWKELSEVVRNRNLFPIFDMAYQGFASGDLTKDALAVRLFTEDGHKIALAQSFSKNMGLYGERVGAFSILTDTADEAVRILLQLQRIIRATYVSPPIHGARIAIKILTDPILKAEWITEIKGIAERILLMRSRLQEALKREGSQRDWSHITDQTGMFCFTGLTPFEIEKLTKEYHIFLTKDGRISMGCINMKNVDYVAHAFHQVTKLIYDLNEILKSPDNENQILIYFFLTY